MRDGHIQWGHEGRGPELGRVIRHRAEALARPLRRVQGIGEAGDSNLKPPVFKFYGFPDPVIVGVSIRRL